MHKWILTSVIGLSIAVCFVVIKFGLRPKPVPIIKASNFEDPKMLGTYIVRQLYQKLNGAPTVAFGMDFSNAYQRSVVESVIKDVSEKNKKATFELLSPNESFSNSGASKQDELRKKYGDQIVVFTIVDLKGVPMAPEVLDCEKDHTYSVWLECIKQQKVRQMSKARRVNLEKPIATVENQSQKDIMIYIRE